MAKFEDITSDSVHAKHNKLDGDSAPGLNNDSTQNYEPGSIWIDTVAQQAYICLNASVGEAVWLQITP